MSVPRWGTVSIAPKWNSNEGREPTHRSGTSASGSSKPFFPTPPSRPGTAFGIPSSALISGTSMPNMACQTPSGFHQTSGNAPHNGVPFVHPNAPADHHNHTHPLPPLPQPSPSAHYGFARRICGYFPPCSIPFTGSPDYHYPIFNDLQDVGGARMRPEDQQVDKLDEKDRLKPDGSNFFIWLTLIKSSLKTKGWLCYAEGNSTRPSILEDPMGYQTWKRADDLTKHQIGMSMEASLYHQLSREAETACEFWTAILQRFKDDSLEAQLDAEIRLGSKRIRAGESMKQHIHDLRKLRDDLLDRGGELSNRKWLLILARSLSEHYLWRREMSYSDENTDPERFISKLERLEMQGYAGVPRGGSAVSKKKAFEREEPWTLRLYCNGSCHLFEDCEGADAGGVHGQPSAEKPKNHDGSERANLVARLEALDRERARLIGKIERNTPRLTEPRSALAPSRPVSPH